MNEPEKVDADLLRVRALIKLLVLRAAAELAKQAVELRRRAG
jgi:hypothetical protein